MDSNRCTATNLERRESKGDHTCTPDFCLRALFSNQVLRKRDQADSRSMTKKRRQTLEFMAARRVGFGKGFRKKRTPLQKAKSKLPTDLLTDS